MAKWGEGDPRWIVEERADATNVNNWHWTEKNATSWSRDKLKTLLEGLTISDDKYSCEIKELTKLEGEAVANNRKGKLIFFYEWDIKAEWKGVVAGSDNSHKGKLEIPNLSEENDADEIHVNVSSNTEKDEAYQLKEFIRLTGTKTIRDKLGLYMTDLQKEFSKGMILPSTANEKSKENGKTPEKNTAKEELSKPVVVEKSPSKPVGVKIPCKKVTDRQTFKCQARDIYRALTEKDMVQAFTRNSAEIVAEKGGRFVLFGGMVIGEFVSLVAYEKIEMLWRFKSWTPSEHYSRVVIDIEEKDDCTELTLTQTGVPEQEVENTRQGWSRYYWQSINQTFGFASSLF